MLALIFYFAVNLAFNRTAEQSSTKNDEGAAKAVDGNFGKRKFYSLAYQEPCKLTEKRN